MRNKTDLIKYKNLLNTYLNIDKYSIDDILNLVQNYLNNLKENDSETKQKINFIKELFYEDSVYLKVYEQGVFPEDLFRNSFLIICNSVGDIWCLVNMENTWKELDLINLVLKDFNINKLKKVVKKLNFLIPIDDSSDILYYLDDLIYKLVNENHINSLDEIVFILKLIGSEIFGDIISEYGKYKKTKDFQFMQEKFKVIVDKIKKINLNKFKILNPEKLVYENYKSRHNFNEIVKEEKLEEKPAMIITENKEPKKKVSIIPKQVEMDNEISRQIYKVNFPFIKQKRFRIGYDKIIVSN